MSANSKLPALRRPNGASVALLAAGAAFLIDQLVTYGAAALANWGYGIGAVILAGYLVSSVAGWLVLRAAGVKSAVWIAISATVLIAANNVSLFPDLSSLWAIAAYTAGSYLVAYALFFWVWTHLPDKWGWLARAALTVVILVAGYTVATYIAGFQSCGSPCVPSKFPPWG